MFDFKEIENIEIRDLIGITLNFKHLPFGILTIEGADIHKIKSKEEILDPGRDLLLKY